MRRTNVTVRTGITYPHPTKSFSNLRHDVTVGADFDETMEDVQDVAGQLAIDARQLVAEMKERALAEVYEDARVAAVPTPNEKGAAEDDLPF